MGQSPNFYERFVFPRLRRTEPETAHERAVRALAFAQATLAGRLAVRVAAGRIPNRPLKVFGLRFPNELGIAAGFDKDVRITLGLAEMGFGHVEVGTLTPRPQAGNPRPRIFRLLEDRALINRMGFPNEGVEAVLPRLRQLAQSRRQFVVGVSLGKQKETPLEDAAADYIAVMRRVYAYSDYLAVNISSPNTPGLRELQGGDYLGGLLKSLMRENCKLANRGCLARRPLLVKIAPDVDDAGLDAILDTAQEAEVDGIIATNTTIARPGSLRSPARNEQGGLSGRPVTRPSTRIIARIHERTRGCLPIIGVGGIESAADAREKLEAGASLLQLYTGLVYRGPRIAGEVLCGLERDQ